MWDRFTDRARKVMQKLVQSGSDMATMGRLPLTPRTKKVIYYSKEEARKLDHNYVGTEHLLLGLLRVEDGVAAQVLMNLGLKLEAVREEVLNLLGPSLPSEEGGQRSGSGRVETALSASEGGSRTPVLDFARHLTEFLAHLRACEVEMRKSLQRARQELENQAAQRALTDLEAQVLEDIRTLQRNLPDSSG